MLAKLLQPMLFLYRKSMRMLVFTLTVMLANLANAQIGDPAPVPPTGNLRGLVTDASTKKPLSGVTVEIYGTNFKTTTNNEGWYRFDEVPVGSYSIVFSKEQMEDGLAKFSIVANNTVTINQSLQSGITQMDDIVIVGYGRQNRRNVVGSISTVSGKDITDMPAPSFEAALQGKASGVQVIVGSGMAGSASLIRIRGASSISAAGDPLYVIDGIPVTQDYFMNRANGSNYGGGFNNNPLASINPDDIENIEILKDAAATSIYGSRGANGVILITTKRARKKGLKFDVSARWGNSNPTRKPDMLTGPEWLQLYQEAWQNDGRTGKPDLSLVGVRMSWDQAQKVNTNWVDQVIGTGFKQNYNVSGNYVGKGFALKGILSYDDNGSFIIGNSYKRISERVNMDIKPMKGVNLQLSHSLSQGTNNRVDASWAGGLGSAMSWMLPIYPLEPLYDSASKSYITPVGLHTIRDLKNWRSVEIRTINNASLSVDVAKGLVWNASGSYDYMDYNEHLYEPAQLIKYYNNNYVQQGNAKWFPTWTRNANYYTTLQYNKQLSDKHSIGAMVGHEFQSSISRGKYVENFDATASIDKSPIDPSAFITDSSRQATAVQFGRTPYEWAFISYFGRFNYSFNNKLNFQVTSRWDGSSRFGRNNRYGFFPAAAIGYILSEESFIKSQKWINFLKLRAGMGKSGNANFDNYARWGTITPSSNLPRYNNQPTLAPARLENPNLRWESTTNFDAGIEFGILKNRISGDITYYNKVTSDVIMNVAIPVSTGFGNFYDNVGEITNQGVEFSLKTINIRNRNFNWTTNFNIARNENKITSIGIYTPDAISGGTNDTRVVVNQPVGTNFLVRFSRIDQATGAPIYLDINGNETTKWDPANRVAVGNVLPKAFGNLGNTITYKGWELNANMYFNWGGNIYESSLKRQVSLMTDWNMDRRVVDRWNGPEDNNAIYPLMTLNTFNHGSTTPWINTDLWLQDGSYIRLRTISVSYKLPAKWLKQSKFDAARVMLVGTNLLTWTRYTGIDPEIARDFENATDRNMSGSITYLTTPQEKSVSIQLNLSF